MCMRAKLLQLWLTLWDPMDCSPSGSSVQARVLKWVAMPFSRGSSQPNTGSNLCLLCLLHWQAGSLPLVPPGKPIERTADLKITLKQCSYREEMTLVPRPEDDTRSRQPTVLGLTHMLFTLFSWFLEHLAYESNVFLLWAWPYAEPKNESNCWLYGKLPTSSISGLPWWISLL